jgi:hypothetical protein
MPLFKIRGSDNNEYGPVSADVVLQWITTNRAGRQTLAQAEGSTEWKPLSDFPEFQGALAAQSAPPPPIAATSSPSSGTTERSQGMAIASLILGICGITCLSLIAGIPAIIFGHIALNRSRKSPTLYSGSGLAIAGLIMGYLSLAWLPVLAGLMLPALAKAKDRAQSINCLQQMRSVGIAVRQYENDNNETYPPNLLVLSNKLSQPKLLVCPSDPGRRRPQSWNDIAIYGSSYQYTVPEAGTLRNASSTEMLRCPIHGTIGFADGSVHLQSRNPRTRP